MIDLIVDALGASLVSVAGYLYMKRGSDSVLDRGIQRFIERNLRLFWEQSLSFARVQFVNDLRFGATTEVASAPIRVDEHPALDVCAPNGFFALLAMNPTPLSWAQWLL